MGLPCTVVVNRQDFDIAHIGGATHKIVEARVGELRVEIVVLCYGGQQSALVVDHVRSHLELVTQN